MSNEILKFAESAGGTDILTQAAYDADAQRLIGNQAGAARRALVNKVLKQTSFISKVFADYLIQQTGGDVLDDGVDATLLAKMTTCFATGVPVGGIVDYSTPNLQAGFLKCNGSAVSRTTYSALFGKLVTDMGYTLQSFSVTIATPAVVTKSGHGFLGGERLRLSTTGSLPTGLDTSTDYFVNYIDANTFRLQTISNVLAGTYVNTSGSQSGTHSYLQSLWGLGDGSTTFNVPDIRGAFRRAWDDGRGLDPSRVIATIQRDAFQGHWHEFWGDLVGGTGGGVNTDRNGSGSLMSNTKVRTAVTDGVNGTPRTATETRPINYAFMPMIKY